ncbi:putative piggyBac transposable element-derived protein 3-like [Triplophysa rosa]|uniref:PiggyBac transposable element-derived protein 3-like n=1 Tax=Triplophysa rosa TaxID=992332 RepID=A0A9W8CC85_TRIRA|nr:putative piggyBac transposable element-derived protein 3-like [Triplophysa rosa]
MIGLFGHVTTHIYFLVLTSYRKDDIKAQKGQLPSSDATIATMPVPLAEKILEPACGDQPRLTIRTRKLTKQLEAAFFKVRPIFQELNTSYKILPFSKWLSVDESMIPYYGRHGYKQFIKGKPIRYGYKVWSLASSGGYLYHMEPYAGVHTLLPETGLGHGPV